MYSTMSDEMLEDLDRANEPVISESFWEPPPFVRDLTAEEIEAGYLLAPRTVEYNANRYEFRWNDDFSGFIPIKLRWWDDASYIAYQSDCGDDGYEPTPKEIAEGEAWQREHDAKEATKAAERAAWEAANPDEICF